MYNGIYERERFAYEHAVLLRWRRLEREGGGLEEKLAEAGIASLAVYGIAGLGEDVRRALTGRRVKVCCYIDRRAAEYPDGLEGLPVRSLAEYAARPDGDAVLVAPEYHFRAIFEDLIEEGVPADRIISLAMALA